MKIEELDPMFALGKYRPGTGAGWKQKIHGKRKRGHQTPGSLKGLSCKASTTDRYMAKTSRSYKHRDYPAWLEKVRRTSKE